MENDIETLHQSATFWRVPMGGDGDTCSLWFKEMKLGHVDGNHRETYCSLFKEEFSIPRAFKVELVARWELDRMEPLYTQEKAS